MKRGSSVQVVGRSNANDGWQSRHVSSYVYQWLRVRARGRFAATLEGARVARVWPFLFGDDAGIQNVKDRSVSETKAESKVKIGWSWAAFLKGPDRGRNFSKDEASQLAHE